MRVKPILVAAVIISAIAFPLLATTTTADNLLAAFNGESNAHARYMAFSAKADAEGYAAVASLFRAAARAEEIHAENHAAVMRELGIAPVANVVTPEVKSTAENLQKAIEGETYEYETMYKDFIDTAQRERQTAAVRTFMLARNAEREHARLYTNDAKSLDSLKGSTSKTFFVCTVCGYTSAKLDFVVCPGCASPKDKFTQVS